MSAPAAGRIAVYTGSFDPITLGHLDVIERASRIFDQLVVGVGINPDKQPLFDQEERVHLVEEAVADLANVTVKRFAGLSVAFVRDQRAQVVLRGVRSLTDIEAEFTMSLANRMLDPGIETVFLMADSQYSHISSSLLKQITPLADDADSCQELVNSLDVEVLASEYSAAAFASLRSQLKAELPKDKEQLIALIRDHLPPATRDSDPPGSLRPAPTESATPSSPPWFPACSCAPPNPDAANPARARWPAWPATARPPESARRA